MACHQREVIAKKTHFCMAFPYVISYVDATSIKDQTEDLLPTSIR